MRKLITTDYPHPEGIFPDSQQYIDKQFAGLDEAELEAITYGTARELFGFAGSSTDAGAV
jgi:hypothetical protein